MRMRWIMLFCATGILMAQDAPATPPKETAKDADKDERQKKARELLDKVDITVAAANPEVNVIVLTGLAGAWKPLDEKRAAGYLQQAFASASALPDDDDRRTRSRIQAEIIKAAALISLPEAAQLLRSMPATPGVDSRLQAANTVISEQIDRKEFDQAMESLALTPSDADYPFGAAQRLFEELPKDDSRRLIVFGNASTAYRRHPGDEFRTFLAKHWKEVPREMAQTALAAVVNEIRDRADEPGTGESLETAKGTVKLASRKSMDLFDLLGVIRELDPVRFKLLREENPDLREAAKRFPDGRQSVDSSGTMRTVARKDGSNSSYNDNSDFGAFPPMSLFMGADESKMQDQIHEYVDAQKKAGEAWSAFQRDHTRGISLADDVVLPLRVQLLLKFATELKKDPAAERNLLSRCESLIGDLEYAGDRVWPAISAAEAEHEMNNDKAAWAAFEQAIAGLVVIYGDDTSATRPNKALREFWPSTLGTRAVMWKAAKILGPQSDELLTSLSSPDLTMLAQVELARALVGASPFDAEHASASWQIQH